MMPWKWKMASLEKIFSLRIKIGYEITVLRWKPEDWSKKPFLWARMGGIK
ncbi:hypothetical protein FACS1894111_00600 [Clostridia bacterium]|nr:hypothetical protein FACS1894111_00600 [Clostridia bacterium]